MARRECAAKYRWRFLPHALIYPFRIFKLGKFVHSLMFIYSKVLRLLRKLSFHNVFGSLIDLEKHNSLTVLHNARIF